MLRSKILSAMIRLSRKSGLYPNCLVLNNVTKVGNHPVAAGGFGEIWQGVIVNQMACLKVVKIYGDSDIYQLLKVRLIKVSSGTSLIFFTGILSGSNRLETA